MDKTNRLSTFAIVRGSYVYVAQAALPALLGTMLFAFTSFATHYIQENQTFGAYSLPFSVCIVGGIGVSWFAMALRQGLGHKRKGFGLWFGREEVTLGLSMLGFVFVVGLVAFLVGFLVFLLVMMISAIGGGALTGADVADAPIFETPEAFRTFLTGTEEGRVIGALGVGVFLAAVLFLFWLVVRLSPFAAAAVEEKRFVVLQAMSWTRFKDVALIAAGLATLGVAATLIIGSRLAIAGLGLSVPVGMVAAHLVTCFCLLIGVGYICQIYRRTTDQAEG